MDRQTLVNKITETVKAWQNTEDEHGRLEVDSGNIDTFIKEICDNIPNPLYDKDVFNPEYAYQVIQGQAQHIEQEKLKGDKLIDIISNLSQVLMKCK